MEEMMETESKAFTKARRKENLKQIFSQLFFAGLFAVSIILPQKFLGSAPSSLSPFKILIALLPVLVITAWTWALTKRIRKLEDFDKSLAVNSFAIAFGVMLWAVTCYELMSAVLIFPAFPVYLLAPMAVILWHVIWEVLRSKYL